MQAMSSLIKSQREINIQLKTVMEKIEKLKMEETTIKNSDNSPEREIKLKKIQSELDSCVSWYNHLLKIEI